MSDFDWRGWIDAERRAAEKRLGSVRTEELIQDPRYARALDIWDRRTRAVRSLDEAERGARAMDAQLTD